MESASLQDYLYLANCVPNGQLKLGRLLKQFGSLCSIRRSLLDQPSSPAQSKDDLLLHLLQQNEGRSEYKSEVDKAFKWAENPSNSIISFEDPRYPALLKEIDDPPPVLYVEGNPELLSRSQIAVIGSRRASVYGLRNAYWLGEELSKLGATITSGMAAGIDCKAHEGALACSGDTVAVVGTGIDICYPRSNKDLRHRIAARGLIISEFPLGSPPHGFHFPQRNRIISGLSLGVVVVEAAMKSGSLITARLAMEQNREVFALPGQITNPMSQGCHHLINDGVKLVQCVDDIAQEIKSWPSDLVSCPNLPQSRQVSNGERLILKTLKAEPSTLDYLLASVNVPEEELIRSLSALEARQLISFSHGRYNYLDRD